MHGVADTMKSVADTMQGVADTMQGVVIMICDAVNMMHGVADVLAEQCVLGMPGLVLLPPYKEK